MWALVVRIPEECILGRSSAKSITPKLPKLCTERQGEATTRRKGARTEKQERQQEREAHRGWKMGLMSQNDKMGIFPNLTPWVK